MSVQILLQGRILGTEPFLLAGSPGEMELAGRFQWINLLSEVLPRALIAELGLSKILLGSSGGEQFLVVLPEEFRQQTEDFLQAARADAAALSQGCVSILWAITENLGDWTVVRKRLNDEMQHKAGTPLAQGAPEAAAHPAAHSTIDAAYFTALGTALRDNASVGWSPEAPAHLLAGSGKHTWTVGSGPASTADAIPIARHTAPSDDGHSAAILPVLAARAQGRAVWGILRGDVDNFGIRIRRVQGIEEHVQISVLYKQFFAGELEVLCSMGEFWRKVTLLYSGGDDFAVCGSWDALIAFGRELQRLFQRFADEHLKDFPGPEGKTITMAVALATELTANPAVIYGRAGQMLELAKSSDKDCVSLLGRTLEWKQLADAAELKDDLTRMVNDFGVGPQYIRELCGIYRETRREKGGRRTEKPWRFHRRLNRILGTGRSREFQKARTSLVADLIGKNPANIKMRPSGRVALEWARLSTEGSNEV
jgi:CRISPR-associated protein Csm1